LIPNATVSIELGSPLDQWETCEPVYNETGAYAGYYNCTWDSTLKTPGWWDIRLNSSKDAYNINSTILDNWFYLQNTPPSYENVSVNPPVSGWGTSYNYSVNVSDVDNDDVTCTLYVSTDGGSFFESKDSMQITNGYGLCSFLINFTCGDIGNDNYFYFRLDDGYNTVQTPTYQGPNITKDTLQITHVSGDNETVNRNTGVLTLKVYVYDTNKGEAVEDNVLVRFNVTHDGTNYTTVGEDNTTLGYAQYDFTPDCSFDVGDQNWTTYISGETCYFDSYSDTYNLTVIGTLSNKVVQPLNAEEFYRGEIVNIRANVTEDCGNLIEPDYINISTISTYTNKVTYCDVVQESTGYYNCTFNSTGKSPRYYDIRVYTKKQYYNPSNYTESNAFWIETKPKIELISTSITPTIGGWGETFTFRVNVTDEDLDEVKVYLYERPGSGEWRLLPPVTGKTKSAGTESQIIEFTYNGFTCNDLLINSSREFFFNGTDDTTPIPSSSVKDYNESQIETFSLERDDISISLVSGDNYVLNRSNVTNGERAVLKVRIYDSDRSDYVSANDLGQFWVTYDGVNFRKDLELNTIEPGGYITDEFPSSDRCFYDIGPQKWKVYFGQNCYKPIWSQEWSINITTTPLEVDLIIPHGEPYRKGEDPITFVGQVTDDCGGVSNANVEFKAIMGTTEYVGYTTSNATGYATYTFSDTSAWTLGYYNGSMYAYKQYYNDSDVLLEENAFVLVTDPVISAFGITTSDSTNPYGWGETWTFDIDVSDEDQNVFDFEAMNISLWINTTNGWELLNSSICSAPNCKVTTTITYHNTFTCEDIGQRIFNVTVNDYWNYTVETTQQLPIIRDDVQLYVTQSPSSVDREDETVLLQSRVYDKDKGEYVGNNVNGTVKVTYDGANYGTAVDISTDADGYLNYNFNPGCSYEVGPQTWRMDVSDSCYSSAAISGYVTSPITIKGQLKNNLLIPINGSVFNVTDQILVRLNTTSDCSNEGLIPNATVSIELGSPLDQWETCEPVYNETGAYAG
ncbi:hypothetical protein DRN74_06585, partial [Candidatus Micrarchaeota archaeon]